MNRTETWLVQRFERGDWQNAGILNGTLEDAVSMFNEHSAARPDLPLDCWRLKNQRTKEVIPGAILVRDAES